MPDITPAILHRHRRRALELLHPDTHEAWMLRWVDIGVSSGLRENALNAQRLEDISTELAWAEQRRVRLVGLEEAEYKHLEEARSLLYHANEGELPVARLSEWMQAEMRLRGL